MPALLTTPSQPSAPSRPLLGSVEPRIWTPPLRELTPDTSYGFQVIAFAKAVLGEPLDPWQEWAVIHAGELLPDGRPRFRQMLVLVARQNGKTHLVKVLALWWLFVCRVPLVLGTSTNLDYARESWESAVLTAESVDALADLVPRNGVRRANGEQTLTTADRCRYKIAASNRKGGRSLTVHRLILDELREHRDWSAWNAAVNTMNAVPDAQAFALSNAGDDGSVVLNELQASAQEFIRSGVGDPRLGLLEWSAHPDCDLLDQAAWAQANPNLVRRIDVDTIAGPAARAAAAGGDQATGFRTEVLCIRVPSLSTAIDPAAWEAGEVEGLDLADQRGRVACCVDVSPDQMHATLAAAALGDDGKVRMVIAAAWDGPSAVRDLRRQLPALVRTIKPRP